MINIEWSIEAIKDFEHNIEYLKNNFAESIVQRFIDKTMEIIQVISINPLAFQTTVYRNIHSVPIVPQVNLYYRIVSKNKIELVRFWNNYQNPTGLDLRD